MGPKRPNLRDVLQALLTTLSPMDEPWVITGSTGLHIRGLPVEPHDIDIQSTARGAYAIEDAAAYEVMTPVALRQAESIRSHFGRGSFVGWQVEIMGAIEKRSPSGDWGAAPEVTTVRRWAEWNGLMLPVLELEYEAGAYEALGRRERAEMIRRFVEAGDQGR